MNFRGIATASLMLVLAGCTTTAGIARNDVEARWLGQSAGSFFAKYGPPNSDSEAGGSTIYAWRGGFKTRAVPAVYETLPDGKKGKKISSARTEYLSCSLQLTVAPDYTIRSIRIVVDKPGQNGKTYCEELLGGE